MILTVISGLWMLWDYAWTIYSNMVWLHAKLAIVAFLIGYHFYCGKLVKDFKEDKNIYGHVFYRWYNEFPVLILISVVILVIVKPF